MTSSNVKYDKTSQHLNDDGVMSQRLAVSLALTIYFAAHSMNGGVNNSLACEICAC